MTKLKLFSVAIVFYFSNSLVAAQTHSAEDFFRQGTEQYLKKDYKKAQELFTQALDLDPENARTLTNLAFSEFQLGRKALAVGLLRRSLVLEPDLFVTRAGLSFAVSQLQLKDIPRQIQLYEALREKLLLPIPEGAYLALSALTLFASGWTFLAFVGRRKRAIAEEKALPSLSVISVLLSLFFVIFTGLLAFKIYDASLVRGTIVIEKVPLQTAPGDNQVSIADLYGGMEVITRATKGDWVQVTYPGSFTGWIKKSALLMTR